MRFLMIFLIGIISAKTLNLNSINRVFFDHYPLLSWHNLTV